MCVFERRPRNKDMLIDAIHCVTVDKDVAIDVAVDMGEERESAAGAE